MRRIRASSVLLFTSTHACSRVAHRPVRPGSAPAKAAHTETRAFKIEVVMQARKRTCREGVALPQWVGYMSDA
eukprot:6177054-Pleurochrysis_carterae.AAC.3